MVKAMETLYLTTTCPDDASWRGAPCNSRDPAEQEGGLAGGEEGEDKNARDEEEDEQEGDDHHGGRLWANMVACPDEQAKFHTVAKACLSPLDEGKPCYMGPPRSKACILAASRSFVPDPTTKKGRKKNGGGGSGGGVASTAEDEFALSTLFHIDDDDEE